MGLRRRSGKWHYRFKVRGQEHSGDTGLAAVERNRKAATDHWQAERLKVLAGLSEAGSLRGVLFATAAKEFLTWAETVQYRGKYETARRLRASFATLTPFLGQLLVHEVTPVWVERYKAWRLGEHRVRDVTLRHDLHALSGFFRRYAIKAGWATRNPVDEVEKPSDIDAVRTHIVTVAEEEAYFAEAWRRQSKNLHDLARLILLQGCRPEEVMALQPADVDVAANLLFIRGGKSRAAKRALPLTGESREILQRRLKLGHEWLFPSPRRSGHIVRLTATHDDVCREARVSFVLYDLRHTFATRLLAAGADVATVARLLGHANLRTVMRYLHPTDEQAREAMKKYEQMMVRPVLKRVK